MTIRTLCTALALTLAAPLAFAEPPTTDVPLPATPPQTQQLTWEQLDADGDGQISREEAARVQSLSEVFDQADSNADGKLTMEEYRAFAERQQAQPPAQATPEPQPEPEEDPAGG